MYSLIRVVHCSIKLFVMRWQTMLNAFNALCTVYVLCYLQ